MEGQQDFNGDVIMELVEERAYFQSKKAEWLERHKNKYVLIKGNELIDVFYSFEDAYKEGVKQFGNQPFLVKKVVEKEKIEKIPALVLGILHAKV